MTQIIDKNNIVFFKEYSDLPFILERYRISSHHVQHPRPDHRHLYLHAIFKFTDFPELKNSKIP